MQNEPTLLRLQLRDHLSRIYHETDWDECVYTLDSLTDAILREAELDPAARLPDQFTDSWNEKDVVLITYGDSVYSEKRKPLRQLQLFLDNYCKNIFTSVHILPFFPFSSDDGFSVIDYLQVNEELGTWQDIENIAAEYKLMADLVINHCSRESFWFNNFVEGAGEGYNFFKTAESDDDLSMVVRPRTSPLLQKILTKSGEKLVWCTFSHDQIDLDFSNPDVLLAFVKIIRQYLNHGVRLFRLDAIAFLWKKPGTISINLDETHEMVRLLRTIIEHAQPDAIVITETNIPVAENLSYFGEANEANWVYNFSLPPLLIHTLLTGNCSHLCQYLKSMPPAIQGTAFFNFIASHDGIGLRPVEGLLSKEEIDQLVSTMSSKGGLVSWRTLESGEKKPYEINISLYDGLQGTINGKDSFGEQRFLCAHAIMLAMEGIPGIYIHSLLATPSDHAGVELTGQNRSINRYRWSAEQLEKQLGDATSQQARILQQLQTLITLRCRQPAFHPNAAHYTLHLGEHLLGFWRQSRDRTQSIFAVSNIDASGHPLSLSDLNVIPYQSWYDLITGEEIDLDAQTLYLEPYRTVWISNKKQ